MLDTGSNSRTRRLNVACGVVTATVAALVGFAVPAASAAGAAVFPVTSCTAGDFASALNQAQAAATGTVQFECAGSIALSAAVQITGGQDVTIDGSQAPAGGVTLSGGQATQLFHVAGGHLTLQDVTIADGLAQASNGVDGGAGSNGQPGAKGADGTNNGGDAGAADAGGDGGNGGDGTNGGDAHGGAIVVDSGATLTVANALFTGNKAIAVTGVMAATAARAAPAAVVGATPTPPVMAARAATGAMVVPEATAGPAVTAATAVTAPAERCTRTSR